MAPQASRLSIRNDRQSRVCAGRSHYQSRSKGIASPAFQRGRNDIVIASIQSPTNRKLVGVAGFEPATSCSQGTRANQAALHPASYSL